MRIDPGPCGHRCFRTLALFAAGTLLVACGGGSSSSNTGAGDKSNPAGYYTGTRVSRISGSATDVVALASDSGELHIFDTAGHAQFVAELDFTDGSLKPQFTGYSAPGTPFPDGSTVCDGGVRGTFQAGATVTASYSCGGDRGSVSLLYDVNDSLQTPSDRFPVVGARGTIRSGAVLFLAVDRDGGVTGSDSAGCSYTGQLAVIDPFIDVDGLTLDQSCGSQTLSFNGLASFGFLPDTATQALYLGVVDGSHSIAGALPYQ